MAGCNETPVVLTEKNLQSPGFSIAFSLAISFLHAQGYPHVGRKGPQTSNVCALRHGHIFAQRARSGAGHERISGGHALCQRPRVDIARPVC